jgi:hypothetical protein
VCIFVVLGGIVLSGCVKMADDKVNNKEYMFFTYYVMLKEEVSRAFAFLEVLKVFLGMTGHRNLL